MALIPLCWDNPSMEQKSARSLLGTNEHQMKSNVWILVLNHLQELAILVKTLGEEVANCQGFLIISQICMTWMQKN
ncbi:hypothetical protein L1987_26371 [Smallanthus sonchifolius]|uniref:Uncharacterized protein n=1 Tax=Smallanthus sonchifolius TaxID=185202 RepID=A0ACB9IAZ6_9ASTR|nr:hypothetical protein L1987_26371 [Smallanthus sonchifolius]